MIQVMLVQPLVDMVEAAHMLLVNIPSWQVLHIHYMLVVAALVAALEVVELHQPEDITAVVMELLVILVLVESVVVVGVEQKYY
jgi:hypothetical protein